MKKRDLGAKILAISSKMPVISLTGPRQSGKTTLVKSLFPHYYYANLEDPQTRQFARENPVGFLKQGTDGIIIDEVQYVPELFSYIQIQVDATKANGKVILTGSQHFQLLESITQSLAGRVAIFNLLPFSLHELQPLGNTSDDALSFILKGFYPRIYDQNIAPEDFYPSYITTYIERDVRQVKNVGDLILFERFLQVCAGHSGQLFNQATIANNLGISLPTVKSWLSILHTSFIVFLLPPYYNNYNKRILKTPKLYFYDTGLLCALLGLKSIKEVQNHYTYGALFENFVVVEMMKQFYNKGIAPKLYFWKDNSGNEIDLVIEKAGIVNAIEIKSGQSLQPTYFKNLEYFKKITDASAENLYCIYGGMENQDWKSGLLRSWKHIPDFG